MNTSAFEVAKRFIGIKEISGSNDNPLIVAMLQLEDTSVTHDEVAWCSAFANFIAFILGLPRSKALNARSWLKIGTPVTLDQAIASNDVVILQRGEGVQPGPDVLNAPGHVGFFAGLSADKTKVSLCAGNQGDSVNIMEFPVSRVLGVRRLA